MKKQLKSNGLKFAWQRFNPVQRTLIIGLIIVISLAPLYIGAIACYSWFIESWNQFAKLFAPYL